ncbi:TonB-dependent receptor plug domain-containing protein [Horticoccus sp. 23ND18S-11]|uniref:TonB-dependent receptor plug domain-containing protein n=1 Tax=Horticoccus sp. 23ND18S-11 TaxID=3391832 RepID=UPI0039C91E88
MNRSLSAAAALVAVALSLATAPFASAQSLAPSPTPAQVAKYDKNKDGKLDAAELAVLRADEAKAGPKDEAITLSVFEVKSDPTDTYEATNTNSVTGTNTALNKTPLDAKVFNRQMLDDMGVVDMTDMLWKVGGLGAALIGNGNEDVRGTVEGDRQDPKSMSMRGLQINNPRRDGFLRSDTTLLDTFDIDRVEAIGGSNSLLFGSGDAGGVITSASKRAYLNRRPTMTVAATGDSEGTRRYTVDAQAGFKYFALRVNGVRDDTNYFRPGLKRHAEGYHVTATVQPWKRLQIRGEYRYYNRDTIFAQAVTVRAPLTWLLPNGTRVDNQSTRYLVAFPEISQITGGAFDITKVDSATGPYTRDDYYNNIKSVVAEATLAEGLAIQLRYGHDDRVNDAPRPSSTTVFAPGATGNLYVDPVTGQVGQKWAFNTSVVATPFWTGARGYRAALAYQKDLGKWFGRHQASLFRQDMESWVNQMTMRFYETDAGGAIIQNPANITNAESGRTVMPAAWVPIFPDAILGGKDWRVSTIQHPNGKTYKFAPQVYADAVPKTAGNPMGVSGTVNATTGNPGNTSYLMDDTTEKSWGASLFSEWWRGKIDTMAGLRREEATGLRKHLGLKRGPISYDSVTLGTVFDTPIKDLRMSFNYGSNGKINFDTTRDIYNEPLPPGKGVSKDVGFKFDLFDRRISGNVNYYQSEAQNFTATFGNRDDVDPNGINGRHGGNAYTYSKKSDGFNLTLSARPTRNWEMRINFATANGSERSNVDLPQFYNDQFNTTTVGGQTVVGVKANASASVAPFLVPSNPADPTSAQVPLSIAMMKDPNSPYFALIDPEGGQIVNAQNLGLFTAGVATGVNGLPITDHQLGFVSPSGGNLIVRRAGEATVGYAERSYSWVNTYRFSEGRLRGLSMGLITSYQQNYRGYMYNDAADGNKRKMFLFPNRMLQDMFASYSFRVSRTMRASLQLNVSNLLDTNRVLYLVNSTNGTLRYAQWFNAPRKFALTTRLTY